jgi:Protein of unknown function (DUF3302)
MFPDYFALGLLFFVVITLFYAVIAVHNVAYEIAKHRAHPHQDAIHVAGRVSLFTLRVIRPLLFLRPGMTAVPLTGELIAPEQPQGSRARDRTDRHRGRSVRLPGASRGSGAGRRLYRALAPLRRHSPHPAQDEELDELRLHRRALR